MRSIVSRGDFCKEPGAGELTDDDDDDDDDNADPDCPHL